MLYNKEKIANIKELLNNADMVELFSQVNHLFSTNESTKDVSLFDLVELGLEKASERKMYIKDIYCKDEGGDGVELEYEEDTGMLCWCGRYYPVADFISQDLVIRLRELAQEGYVLNQTEDWSRKDV